MASHFSPAPSRRRQATARSRLVAAIAFDLWRAKGETGTIFASGVERSTGLGIVAEDQDVSDVALFRSHLWRGELRGGLR